MGAAVSSQPMRIVIHDFGGYSFSAQLARALAARGHEVAYLFADGIKVPRTVMAEAGGSIPRLTVRGIHIGPTYHAAAGVRRMFQERRYGRLLATEMGRAHPDVVLSANTPLDAQAIAAAAAGAGDVAFVHWCQDLYSLAISQLLGRRLPPIAKLIGARFARVERGLMRRADAVVVISEDFLGILDKWGIPDESVIIQHNWSPLDEVVPMPRTNPWAVEHKTTDSVTFLYAGTLGRKHDEGLLVRLARDLPAATIIVAAEGAAADRLRSTTLPHNMTLLPLQPATALSEMLGAADVLIAQLEPDAGRFSVPSKILTYLAAGRPVLAAIPGENLAARTIIEADGGIVVEPTDGDAFIRAARSLADDEAARAVAGLNARSYAEAHFGIDGIAGRFERVLAAAVQRAHSRTGGSVNTAEAQ